MDPEKKKRLERAGWKVGTVREFVGLSESDSAYIEIKLRLSKALANQRARRRLTQVEAAKVLRSSQSRVAKMETGDPSVSTDRLIRSLLRLGATRKEVGRVLGA